MTAATTHLKLAQESYERLQDGAGALALWAAGLHVGIDRTEMFRDARYPAKPAKARAVAAYILTTYLDFSNDAAAVIVGCTDRRHLQKLKTRIIDERDRDRALDAFLDEIGVLVAPRRAA